METFTVKHSEGIVRFLIVSVCCLLASCASMNQVKKGNVIGGIIGTPFELAGNALESTSILGGEAPAWVGRLPQTLTDQSDGAKVVFPRNYKYGAVTWSGGRDEKGFASGLGTLQVTGKNGAYSHSDSGSMKAGKWYGTTTQTESNGKEWSVAWEDGEQKSRKRIYSAAELEQQRLASIESDRRARESLAKFGRWLGGVMSSGSSSSSSSSGYSSSSTPSSSPYENCICTYDQMKGENRSSGTNTIGIRSSRGNWTVSYSFGSSGYLISGGGNLEGRSINVRFDGGRPASLQCSAGSGYCTVTSASRQ